MENKKYICNFCGKIIKNNYSALIAHEKMCEYNPLNTELYAPYEYQGVCEKCGKEFVKIFKTKKLFIRDYQNVRDKEVYKRVKKIKNKEYKERYLSSLL